MSYIIIIVSYLIRRNVDSLSSHSNTKKKKKSKKNRRTLEARVHTGGSLLFVHVYAAPRWNVQVSCACVFSIEGSRECFGHAHATCAPRADKREKTQTASSVVRNYRVARVPRLRYARSRMRTRMMQVHDVCAYRVGTRTTYHLVVPIVAQITASAAARCVQPY